MSNYERKYSELTLLENWLHRRKISRADFAKMMGVKVSTVNLWINGIERPRLGRALEMERMTGIDAGYFNTEVTACRALMAYKPGHPVIKGGFWDKNNPMPDLTDHLTPSSNQVEGYGQETETEPDVED